MTQAFGSLDRAGLAARAVASFPNGAVVMFDLDLRYLMVDGAGLEAVGLTREGSEGKTVWEAFPPETAGALEGLYRAAIDDGQDTVFDVPYLDRIFEVRVVPVLEDGSIVGGLSVTQDVSRAREVERSLDEAEARFRSAFENAPIGIALVGLDGAWLRVNRALCDLLGYTVEEFLSTSFQDITHPDDLDADLEFVAQMLSGEIRAYQMEKRYIRKDGGPVWAVLSVSLVRDDDDQPRYFVSQIVDMSERRHYEEELSARANELERANEALRAMDVLKDDFIAVASHELRSPLTSVRGSISTMKDRWTELTEGERLELLDIADAQSVRLHQLTDELLTLSRIESGSVEVRSARVLLAPLVADVVAAIAPDHGFSVTCDGAAAVNADPTHVSQMLTNYVSNAIKYGAPPFSVDVATLEAGVEIRVRDGGSGVGAAFVDRLFDKFSRSAARPEVPGTGLGLSIVRGLAELNGGSTWYEGSGSGAVFALRLPVGT